MNRYKVEATDKEGKPINYEVLADDLEPSGSFILFKNALHISMVLNHHTFDRVICVERNIRK